MSEYEINMKIIFIYKHIEDKVNQFYVSDSSIRRRSYSPSGGGASQNHRQEVTGLEGEEQVQLHQTQLEPEPGFWVT